MTAEKSTADAAADPDSEAYEAAYSALFEIYEGAAAGLRRATAIMGLISTSPDADTDVQESADTAAHHLRETRAYVEQLFDWRAEHMPAPDQESDDS
jgi:hypothetical protein